MFVRQGYSVIRRDPLPAPADIAITGLCFAPKAVFVYPLFNSTPGAFETAGGFRPPAAHFANSFAGQIGSDFSQTSHWDSGQVAYGEEDNAYLGGFPVGATTVSYDADGFTLHFPFIQTYYFYWLAIGGDNCEAFAGVYQTPVAPATTPVAVTGVGFQPDFLFVMTGQDDGFVSASVCMGMASGPSEQASVAACMGVFGTAYHTLLDGYLTCPIDNSGGNYNQTQLASFDSDGFTVNVVNNYNSDSKRHVYYVAIKDPDSQFSVGVDTQKTSTGSKATTGLGFQPGGGIFLGSFKTVDNDFTYAASPDGTPMLSMGAADGLLNAGCLTEFNQPGGFGGHDQNGYQDIDTVIAIGQATPLQVLARAEISSWDLDGFTLFWPISDGVARFFIYGVFETITVDPCDEYIPLIYRWLKR